MVCMYYSDSANKASLDYFNSKGLNLERYILLSVSSKVFCRYGNNTAVAIVGIKAFAIAQD